MILRWEPNLFMTLLTWMSCFSNLRFKLFYYLIWYSFFFQYSHISKNFIAIGGKKEYQPSFLKPRVPVRVERGDGNEEISFLEIDKFEVFDFFLPWSLHCTWGILQRYMFQASWHYIIIIRCVLYIYIFNLFLIFI
jgi:hypothetical protein